MKGKGGKACIAAMALSVAIGTLSVGMQTEAGWQADGRGWWWNENGSYPANQWKNIDGSWYWFEENGYMTTGWQWIDGAWYYMNGSGVMTTGWQWVDGAWYYLSGNGTMAANTWVGNYYVNGSGVMQTNTWIGNDYVGADGLWIPAQWIQDGNGWWYRHGDGGYTRNNWEWINGSWYLFDQNGYMKTGWQQVNGSWYYLYESGAMASNTWIGNYFLRENGTMAVNQWIGNNYVGSDGCWVPGKQPESGNGSTESKPDEKPEVKPEYRYELKILNTYNELYTENNFATPIVYIKTNNPNADRITVVADPQIYGIMNIAGYEDVQGESQAGNWLKVDGGFLYHPIAENAGTYTLRVYEILEGHEEDYLYTGDLRYACKTDATLTIEIKDYKQAYEAWIQSLVNKNTTSKMTPKEKFEAIVFGEFTGENGYRYDAVMKGENGKYHKVMLLKEEGTIWQNRRLNSSNSPALLESIGKKVGYDVKAVSWDLSNPYHAYVETPDGGMLTICPLINTGEMTKIDYVDFSEY